MTNYQKLLNDKKTEKKSSDEEVSGNNNIEVTHLGKFDQQAEKSNSQKALQLTASKAAQYSENSSSAKFQSEVNKVTQKFDYEEVESETVSENTEIIQDVGEKENGTPNDAPQDQEQEAKGIEGSISLKPETIILGGSQGLYSRIKSAFGNDTSFGKLLKLVQKFETFEDSEEKDKLKPEIVGVAKEWLKKHPEPKNEKKNKGFKGFFKGLGKKINDLTGKTKNQETKRKSIKLLVEQMGNTAKNQNVEVVRMANKNSLGDKIKSVFGFKTTFQEIEKDYLKYQNKVSGALSGMEPLLEVLKEMGHILNKIQRWRQEHQEDKEKDDKQIISQRGALKKMESGIAKMYISVRFNQNINATVDGLSLSELKKGIFEAQRIALFVTIADKSISGSGQNIKISKNGFDFEEIKINYGDSINVTEGFKVKDPNLIVGKKGSNYTISADGNIDLDVDTSDVKLQANGRVGLTYLTETSKFDQPVLKGVSVRAQLFGDKLSLSASDIDFSKGLFTAKQGTLLLQQFGVEGKASALRFSKKTGLDWDNISVTVNHNIAAGDIIKLDSPRAKIMGKAKNYEYELDGTLGLNVPLPKNATLGANGDVHIDGNSRDNSYSVNVTNGGLDLKINDLVEARSTGINFNQETQTLSAASTTMLLSLYDKQLSANVSDLEASKTGIDWSLAKFALSDLALGNFIHVSGIEAGLKGKKDNYDAYAKGILDIKEDLIPGAVINAKGIGVNFSREKGKWAFGLEGSHLGISLFDGKLIADAEEVKYEAGKLSLEQTAISLNLPYAGQLDATGKKVNIDIEGRKIDWESLTTKLPEMELGSLKLDAGQAEVMGKKNYPLKINEIGAQFSQGSWIEAKGGASLLWDYKTKKMPEVQDYNMDFSVNSPKMPDAFLPAGLWPVSFKFVFPFLAGPIPVEAGLEFNASAGLSLGVQGSVKKVGKQSKLEGDVDTTAALSVALKGYGSVGSSAAISIGGFIQGKAEANAGMHLALKGDIDESFNFISLNGDFAVNADFIAALSAGVEARALVVFQKTLYEVTLKQWDLGTSTFEGSYDFTGKEPKLDKKSGLFKGNETSKADINPPKEDQISLNTKGYTQAMNKFYEMLQADNIPLNTDLDVGEDRVYSEDALLAKKETLISALTASIKKTTNDKNYNKYKNKYDKCENKLLQKKTKHENEVQKIKDYIEAIKTNDRSFFQKLRDKITLKSQESYEKALIKADESYKINVEKDLDKLKEYDSKLSLYKMQIFQSETYIKNIDNLMSNLDVSLSQIESEIKQYTEKQKEQSESRYSLEYFLADTEFAEKEVDYDFDDE